MNQKPVMDRPMPDVEDTTLFAANYRMFNVLLIYYLTDLSNLI
jgi:hypothetical protein